MDKIEMLAKLLYEREFEGFDAKWEDLSKRHSAAHKLWMDKAQATVELVEYAESLSTSEQLLAAYERDREARARKAEEARVQQHQNIMDIINGRDYA